MCVDAVKDVESMITLPLLALFPGFISPFSDEEMGEGGKAPISLWKARGVWLNKCVMCLLVSNLCTQLNDPSLNNGH